jgi:hypothetical protein
MGNVNRNNSNSKGNISNQYIQEPKQQYFISYPQELDYYPIRLQPEQSITLFGYFGAKTTLTWRDILTSPTINLRLCVECGIDLQKLYRMQPEIKEWFKYGKASIQDCASMDPWKPNPLVDLGCSIGDLVLYRKIIHPKLLSNSGLTFTILKERHGLTIDLMRLLKYNLNDWILLEITESFVNEINDTQFFQIFGNISKSDILSMIKKQYNSSDNKKSNDDNNNMDDGLATRSGEILNYGLAI